MTEPRPVTDEPVRGVVAPPWLTSLPGIERMRLYARGFLPRTPLARLIGFGIGHVSTGTLTGTMKASGHLMFIPGYNLTPLIRQTLGACALTAIGAGQDVDAITSSLQYLRPPLPQPGSFLCRARVLNASSVFVSCAAEIEDPVGRLVAHAIAQYAIRTVDPPPPSPPASIEPIEEATYATPDPPDRAPVGSNPSADLQRRFNGLELARMVVSGELPPVPLMNTFGVRWISAEDGSSQMTMPASEWFCSQSHDLRSSVAPESLLNVASTAAGVTQWAPGQSVAILEMNTTLLHSVAADGRQLSAHGRVSHRAGSLFITESEAVDADGNTFAVQTGTFALLDPRDRRSEPERVLATLLFTDIVGSTQMAERMGDAAWRQLLGEHNGIVRRQLGAHRGREVKTTGDGFLARFESPAAAIRCAMAIRNDVRQHRLDMRIGIHTGECEVQGTDLTGIAVHVAARIMSLAGAGEIFVSQTVRDLASGSGLRFTDRGLHELKGVEGEANVFSVEI